MPSADSSRTGSLWESSRTAYLAEMRLAFMTPRTVTKTTASLHARMAEHWIKRRRIRKAMRSAFLAAWYEQVGGTYTYIDDARYKPILTGLTS